MGRAISLLPLLLFISGCTNPYSRFYVGRPGNLLDVSNIIVPLDEPKLKRGYDPDVDEKNMLENGYLLIGFSSFNAGEVSENGALEQARRVQADTVYVY